MALVGFLVLGIHAGQSGLVGVDAIDHGYVELLARGARHAERGVVDGLNRYLGRVLYLRHPLIGRAVGAVDHVGAKAGRRCLEVGAQILPDNLVLGRDLDQMTVGALSDKRVAVGQTLGRADERRVEAAAVGKGEPAGFERGVLPRDLERDGVELQNARVVAVDGVGAVGRDGVGRVVSRGTAVIEDQQIALAGKALGDHMKVMLADNPADLFLGIAAVEARAEFPDDLARLFGDDGQDIGVAAVEDEVFGGKALVAAVIPLVGAELRDAVDVQPVAAGLAAHGGIVVERLFGCLVKAELFKMLRRAPLPDNLAVPGDLDDLVVDQQLVADLGVVAILVRENDGVAAVRAWL